MRLTPRFGSFLPALLLTPLVALSAQTPQSAQATPDQMTIHVTVDNKSGDPVEGLPQDNFTLADNRKPEPITGFRALQDRKTSVIIVLDAVNLPYTMVSYARQQLASFLTSNDGQLGQPTTIAVLQDTGVQIEPQFTTNGAQLRATLDRFSIGLRNVTRSTGFYGAEERLQISLQALDSLAAQHLTQGPTRVIWISPGWPLLSGPAIELSNSQANSIFTNVVALTTQMHRAQMTVDLVNPVGAAENVGRAYYYENFLHAPRAPRDVDLADLSLQVIAIQSGGLVLNGSNDISGLLQRIMKQTHDGYDLTFAPAPGERNNEYHELQVKVRQPGLAVHTTAGYYARPVYPPQPAPTPVPLSR